MTFFWSVLPVTQLHAQGIVPYLAPAVCQDVADAFEVALTGDDFAVWLYAHTYPACAAGLYSKLQLHGVGYTVLGWGVP